MNAAFRSAACANCHAPSTPVSKEVRSQRGAMAAEYLVKAHCANCRFFAEYMEEEVSPESEATGECRRFPPVMPKGQRRAVHPIVRAANWCGEHRPPFTTKVEGGAQ